MAWARIDDKFLDNPKVRKAGKEATYLYLSALVYSSSQLTEGFVSDEALGLVAFKGFIRNEQTHAEKLVECGLWDHVKGGYRIHDYLQYNPTKAEIEQARNKKATAGSMGAKARWQANPKQTDSKDDGKPIADAMAERWQGDGINPSHPIPIPNPLKETPAAAAFSGKNAELYAQFEAITPVNDRIVTAIDSAVNLYSSGWVRDAIAEATGKGKTFGYVNSILERWKREGRNGKAKRADGGTYESWKAVQA